MYLTSVYQAKSVLKSKSNIENNDIVELHRTQRRLAAPGDHTRYFVVHDKMINYQRIKLKISQLIKFLFYIPYKICIDFILPV